jgi:NADH:ubiquinone oxidoreductase subunit D
LDLLEEKKLSIGTYLVPMLRASGVQWDLRKVDHYECYDELDWQD